METTPATPDQLNADKIEAACAGGTFGRKVIVFKSTQSTNDIAWGYASNPANDGLVVFAEEQRAGRGRRGNKWFSEEGQSILCSAVLTKITIGSELLTIAAAVATAEAIATHTGVGARIKWPNDIMIRGRKVCGILVESRTVGDRTACVVGVGINCHQDERFFREYDLRMPATSIDIATGRVCSRNALAAELLKRLDFWIDRAAAGPDQVIDGWRRLSSQLGEYVTVEHNNRQYSGFCIGVDPIQGLVLQLTGGGVRMFEAAQTTIVRHTY